MLKTGKRCTWEEIEVGEVFAWVGCWAVGYKVDKDTAFWLAEDTIDSVRINEFDYGMDWGSWNDMNDKYRKLPQSVQKLWRCDE